MEAAYTLARREWGAYLLGFGVLIATGELGGAEGVASDAAARASATSLKLRPAAAPLSGGPACSSAAAGLSLESSNSGPTLRPC